MFKALDISKHQTAYDAQKTASKGIDTVFCRCAYGTRQDETFSNYAAKTLAAGMALGAYGFATWHYSSVNGGSVEKARIEMRSQMKTWIALCKAAGVNSWFGHDIEMESGQSIGLSKTDLTTLALEGNEMLSDAGLHPCTYASASWLCGQFDERIHAKPMWVARYYWDPKDPDFDDANSGAQPGSGNYTTQINSWGSNVVLWQFGRIGYASDYGIKHGSNNVDRNFLYRKPSEAQKPNKTLMFDGRNEVPFWYSVYNAKRSKGPHRGIDVRGLDSDRILCPVNGTVRTATIITNKSDPTWEWGWYLRIDDAQGNKHYFAHCLVSSFAVQPGSKVQKGQVIARMGCSGNAALALPPIPHVHYEVRTAGNAYLNPCGFLDMPNAVGVHSAGHLDTAQPMRIVVTGENCEYFSTQSVDEPIGKLQKGTLYDVVSYDSNETVIGTTRGHWVCFAMQNGEQYYCLVLPDRAVVENVPAARQPAIGDTVRANATLNVRTAPGTDRLLLCKMMPGEKGKIADIAMDSCYIAGKGWVVLAGVEWAV